MANTFSRPYGNPPRMHGPVAAPSRRGQRLNAFTLQGLFLNLLLISCLAFMNKAGTPGSAVFFALAAGFTLKSSEWALKMVAMTLLVVVCNDAFVPKSVLLGPLRFGIWFLAAARIGWDILQAGRLQVVLSKPYYIALILFCAISLVFAIFGGWFVLISALKLLSFFVGATVILIGAEEASLKGSELTCWFYSIMIFSVLLGILAYVTGQGYNAKLDPDMVQYYAGLFNGPFYHPQTLGPAAALMIIYLLCVLLYTPYKYRWLGWGLILVLLVFLYMSSSRTALAALAIGGVASVGAGFVFQRKGDLFVRLNISRTKIVALALVAAFGLFMSEFFTGGAVTGKFTSLVTKQIGEGRRSLSLSDISFQGIISSREGQINQMLYDIERHPMTGIGFGVDRSAGFAANASWFTAPTEKGFLPLAVIQENGYVGALFFWVFVVLLYRKFIIDRNIPGLGVFTALLGANMGEMMFFGLGGQGGFMWVLLGGAVALGPRCVTRRNPMGAPMH